MLTKSKMSCTARLLLDWPRLRSGVLLVLVSLSSPDRGKHPGHFLVVKIEKELPILKLEEIQSIYF